MKIFINIKPAELNQPSEVQKSIITFTATNSKGDSKFVAVTTDPDGSLTVDRFQAALKTFQKYAQSIY